MDPGHAVGRPGDAHHLAPGHPLASGDIDAGQIGQRHLEPWDRLDGQSPHPGHRPGESDPTRGRGFDPRPDLGCIVDTPVARKLTGRGESGNDRSFDRWRQADRKYG